MGTIEPVQRTVTYALQFGDILLIPATQGVMRRAREVRLSSIEFRLLAYFMENPGRVLSRQELFRAVWGSRLFVQGRSIDVSVGRLRKALTRNKERDLIRTVRGEGYALGDCGKSEDGTALAWAVAPETSAGIPSAEVARRAGARFYRRSGIELDRGSLCVRRTGRDLYVSPKPFAVLDLLISSPGTVFSREQVAELISGNSDIDLRTVDAVVGRLRKSINQGVLADPIRTVVGLGYKFSEFFEEQHREWPAPRKKKLRLPLRNYIPEK